MPGPFDAPEVTVTCKDGGTWDYPAKWPHCVDSELNSKKFNNTSMCLVRVANMFLQIDHIYHVNHKQYIEF